MEQHIIVVCTNKGALGRLNTGFFCCPFQFVFWVCRQTTAFFTVTTVPQLFMTLHVFFRFKSGIIGFKVYLDFNYISLLLAHDHESVNEPKRAQIANVI